MGREVFLTPHGPHMHTTIASQDLRLLDKYNNNYIKNIKIIQKIIFDISTIIQ